MYKIIVVALTRGTRNKTFNECLVSLQALTNIGGYSIDNLVVENNSQPDEHVKKVISYYDNNDKCVKHLLEPMSGILHARNAALNFAKAQWYTYLAFIDDAFV